jgi:hypothetical protein
MMMYCRKLFYEDNKLETKTLVKEIKAKNRASNGYVFASVLSGVGTTLLTVALVLCFSRERLPRNG